MTLKNHTAVITGASRGIGRAIAIRFAEAGCDIVVNYSRDEAGAHETAGLIGAIGRKAIVVPADVAEAPQCAQLAEAAAAAFGKIDILINNAGITRDGLLATLEPDDVAAVIRTNLLGAIYATQAVSKYMVRQRSGRIVNISSSAAAKPGRGQSNYAAAKGGLEAFTRAMAVELAPRNILVNAIAPGVVATEMSGEIRASADEKIKALLLLKRYADPREVADLALFLAAPSNLYMTGEVLALNGGLKMA